MGSQKTMLQPGSGGQFGLNAGDANMRLSGNPVPYLMPWTTAFVLLILAVAIRYGLARDTLSWYWSLFTTAVYGCLTALAWWTSRARGKVTHTLATGGVAAGGLWSWYIAGVPDLTWRPFAVYVGAAIVICGGSNFFVAFRNGPGNGAGMHEQVSGAVAKLRALNEVTVKDGQVQARYEMEPGTAAADLQGSTKELASLYGVGPDAVRVLPSGDDARVGQMRINPTNALATSPMWPGPSIRAGGSIMDPLVTGARRGGQPLQLWLPGDADQDRNATPILQVTGMPGAGKTEFIRFMLLELLSRGMPDEVEYWYGNSRKADQEPDWVKRGAARFERDRKGVATMLHDLRAEAPERARILGEQGLDQWVPGCGLAYRLVVCDEFADVAPDVERLLTDLAETVRSLGIALLLGFQRASGSRFPTDARSNVGTHACFGVKDEVDAGMALPDEVLEAGAQPWQWTNKVPGMCYLTAPGIDEDLWTDEARTFRPNRDLMAKWAEFYLAQREGRAATAPVQLQPATRPAVVPTAYTASQPAERESASDLQEQRDTEALDDVIDLDDIDEGEAADEVDDVLDEISDDLGDDELDDVDDDMPAKPHVPEDCLDAVGINHREPIEVSGGGMRLALSPQMPPSEARAFVRRFLADLHSTGVRRFKKEDMAGDVLAAVGYRASWLDKVLAEFAGERPIWLVRTDDRGWYDINASPLLALEGDAA